MIYEVLAAQDDYTEFIGSKTFWFLHNARKFANSKAEYFDIVLIQRTSGNLIEVIKEPNAKTDL
jgi:hypothetical protein